MLNEQQRKAAEFDGKHLLVLAGAGTGKTKTIIGRAEYLINKGIPPYQIAILSFTRKSAQEIAERIKSSISNQSIGKNLSGKTFHSWCNEIIQSYPDYFPQSKFTLLDEDDRNSAIGLSVGRKFKDSQGQKLNSDIISRIYSYAVNTQTSLSHSIKHLRYYHSTLEGDDLSKAIDDDREIIAPIIKNYIDYKKSRRYIDYDDILNIVATALETNDVIRETVTSRWKHILVDEMQDTNPLQYKLLSSFISNCHLFCVGDDAQSIYGFRGADFRIIHSFTEIVPQSECYKLSINYRSTQEILDVSNWLLTQSNLNYDKNLISNTGNGSKPALMHTENEWEEANYVADEIQKSVEVDGERFSDYMVLGRTGFSLSKVEGVFLQKKIPYIKLGGISLMQSAHIRDVVSCLRVIINQYDEIAWMRLLKLFPGVGDVTATKIINDILENDGLEQIEYLFETKNYFKQSSLVAKILKDGSESIHNPSKTISTVVDLLEETLKQKYKEEWDWRYRDFEVLIEVAKSCGSISEFITEYVLDPKAETTLKLGGTTVEDVVTLSTIHSAKGLEARNVHILGVNPYNYPSPRSIREGDDTIEEERRCLYVALTRAQEKLTIHRNIYCLHSQSMSEHSEEEVPDETFYYENGSKSDSNENEELYFLNELPFELVNVKVSEGQENLINKNIQPTDPAEFPDFNFE